MNGSYKALGRGVELNRSSLLPLITFYGLDTTIGLLGGHGRRPAHKLAAILLRRLPFGLVAQDRLLDAIEGLEIFSQRQQSVYTRYYYLP